MKFRASPGRVANKKSKITEIVLNFNNLLFSLKKSECGLPNDHFGRLTSVTLVLIIKKKLGSAQVPKFGRFPNRCRRVYLDQKPTKLGNLGAP